MNLIREMEQLDRGNLSSGLELNLDKKTAEEDEVRKSSGENSDSSLHLEDMGGLPRPLLPAAASSVDEYVSKRTVVLLSLGGLNLGPFQQ